MTLCNMAVETGGTCGICYPDMTTVDYLWEFIQDEYENKTVALESFKKIISDPDAVYDDVIEHDIARLTPQTTFGYRPDNVKPVKEMEETKIDQVYIGSCTNGRIEDLRVAAKVLKGKKINDNVRAIVSPATQKIYHQALKEGSTGDIYGCRVLRYKSDMRGMPGDEQRRPRKGGGLCFYNKPQL